jgi:acetate kinase
MGGVDILIFTGGIGENAAETRENICRNLEFMGIEFDKTRNDGSRGKDMIISKKDSRVTVMIVPTNEELVIASDTRSIVEQRQV